jgi:hypothetical protein
MEFVEIYLSSNQDFLASSSVLCLATPKNLARRKKEQEQQEQEQASKQASLHHNAGPSGCPHATSPP